MARPNNYFAPSSGPIQTTPFCDAASLYKGLPSPCLHATKSFNRPLSVAFASLGLFDTIMMKPQQSPADLAYGGRSGHQF